MSGHDAHDLHLDSVSLARYLEGGTEGDERAGLDAHLAQCPECRAELIESRRILATGPRHNPWWVLGPAAAAAVVLALVWTGSLHHPQAEPITRDAPLTTTSAPLPVAPVGNVFRADTLRWRAVPGVLHYRVTLFTDEGEAIWQTTTTDSFVAPPDTSALVPATPYYWQVKAETSFGRWVESELVGFTIVPPAPE